MLVFCNAINLSPGVLSLGTFCPLNAKQLFIRGFASPSPFKGVGRKYGESGLTLLCYILSKGSYYLSRSPSKPPFCLYNMKMASLIGLCCTAYNYNTAPMRIRRDCVDMRLLHLDRNGQYIYIYIYIYMYK